MDENFFQALDRAVAVASAHERELLSYPGVISVGAGPKRTQGNLTGQAAIVITVRRKLTDRELESRGEKPLPGELEGIPLDVIEEGQPVEAPEIVAAQEKARAVLERMKSQWLSTPNITGIGVGYKTTKGQTNFKQIALKFYVARKLPPEELQRQNLPGVPRDIDGVVTDVEELPPMRPSASASGSRADRKDPLVGGLTVGVNTKPFWFGTLGALVFDRTSGEQMVLSNQHVLDGPPGTEVVQPSPIGLDDSLEIGFQLDICNPVHFFRLDTPNTTVGSVLAGAAAAAALAAALSDEIDPTRRGQDATIPPAGEKTVLEDQQVKLEYPELPIPGTHFKINTSWDYVRHTDANQYTLHVEETRENPHVLADKLLITDKTLYHPGETIRLFACILPEDCARDIPDQDPRRSINAEEIDALSRHVDQTPPSLLAAIQGRAIQEATATTAVAAAARPCPCNCFQVTALLTPTKVDRAFPIVLREPTFKLKGKLLNELLAIVRHLDDKDLLERVYRLVRYGCFYTGELTISNIPAGPWRHYLYVQTVNCAPDNMKPLEAAQIIGGLPVSQNMKPALDIACGPIVYEDGQFDIELT